ncbi:hypothetical protein GGR92_001055 [Spirosoma lacussanchae]|uniref:hypothetical protein n=1 Tax=Spirosoma lacussanchae TaxID=1884249 RepID=UPI001109706A|nr:hypothetical protein [Spirosoma lacussanchae]
MEKLNPQQVARLYDHLVRSGTDTDLLPELLDHLACEVEYYIWLGLPFESAMDKALMEADVNAVQTLRQTYQRELSLSGLQLESASKDDILFQFRNKAYGAYYLRQAYPTALRNAFGLTLGLFMMLIGLMHMIGRGSFSYFSIWGALWLGGLVAVTLASLSWYLENERQRIQLG